MNAIRVVHFAILLIILSTGIGMFFANAHDASFQFAIGVITAFCYVVWGVTHHLVMQDLHRKVVIEYVLIATIAIVLLYTALGF